MTVGRGDLKRFLLPDWFGTFRSTDGTASTGNRGEVIVILHDDPYFHLNVAAETSVAATYEIDATVTDGEISGRHRGTFGYAWSRAGKISGTVGE